MRRLFTMMSEQVQVTGQQLQAWWATLSPDPRTWLPFTWVLAGLVVIILLALIIRPRRRARARRPELLISHGELRVAAWAAPKVVSSLQAPDRAAFELAMTVSNLSASPVQLLELAVRTNRASAATTAEVAAVLPPHGAVDVSAELQDAGGDEGVLDLFVYVPDMPPKTFRVRARLRWEPWNARYRVLPLDQRVDVARGLSERTQRRRRASAWRRDAGGPAALGGSSSSSRGAPLYSVEGYFEPRPESSRPRSEQPSPREGSRRPAAPAAPAAFQEEAGDRAAERRAPAPDARTVADEETWPPARPPREQRRARVPEPDPYGWMAEQEADAPRPGDAAGRRRRRGASDASGRRDAPGRADVAGAEEGGAGDADGGGNVWRLGDAERSGLGRAARAARGTERDGAGGTVGPSRHPGRRSESERPRSWAVRSDAVPSAPDLGPGELVGPDEEPAPRTRPAGAGGAREARAPAPGGAAGAVGDASGAARKAPAVSEAPAVPEAPARGGLSGATDDDVGPSRTPPKAPAADAVEESGAGDESREERPRPRLEFPDEF